MRDAAGYDVLNIVFTGILSPFLVGWWIGIESGSNVLAWICAAASS